VPAMRRTADRSPLTACGMLNKKFRHPILHILVVPSPLQLGNSGNAGVARRVAMCDVTWTRGIALAWRHNLHAS
jgi:hypothetical protein